MGWFAKIEKTENEVVISSDPNNPYSRNIEDEGEYITIVHTRNIEKLEKEEKDGSTSNTSNISE